MSSNHHSDQVFKEKRVPKGPIKFQIQLNEEQKEAKQTIIDSTVSIIRGKAGSGKSLLAAQVALDMLFKKEIEKIIIARPAVTAGEQIGFLPGSKDEKMAPFTAPVFDNMNRLYSKDKIEKLVLDGLIEIIPVGFLRGFNFTNCVVIIDEAQNCTEIQLELILGRLCMGSKIIICGDSAQVDLKNKKDSGFDFICKHMKDITGFSIIALQTNHRHPIVEDILKVFDSYRN
jgi:phosphate starvation-inducible protein PhoH and related proteins